MPLPMPRRLAIAVALLLLPWLLQALGTHAVRVAGMASLYVLLALGLNIVVGWAGLLDLGYVAFYALGAYLFALLASPHLTEQFAALAAHFPQGLHTPWWLVLPAAALLAAAAGRLLGWPTLKLRGDYLALVTLAGGEIVRLFIINLGHPVNLTDGAKGLGRLDALQVFGIPFNRPLVLGPLVLLPVTLHLYLFLAVLLLVLLACRGLQHSRFGRAWAAMREDEPAAAAMGLDLRALKLLAFGLGAAIGGVAGVLFAAFQGFVSPEAFTLQESVMIVAMVVLGGGGQVGAVVAAALLLAVLPEALRYVVGPLQEATQGRINAGILRQFLVALAMIVVVRWRPHGLWPPRRPPPQPQPPVIPPA